jgi:[protein-PII] uridylyltransferase
MTLNSPLTGLNTPEDSDSLRLHDGSLLRQCQRIYKLEMQSLRWRHWNGAEGSIVTVGRSALVDRLIQAVFESAVRELPGLGRQPAGALRNAVWIALGEYGRLELAPHSPVDVLLLVKPHAKHETDSGLEAAVRGVLSSLGFEIRLSVLTVKECLHRAQAQFPFAFACLGARRVSGDLAVFQEWNQRFWANLAKNQMAFLSELTDYLAALHDDHGSSVYSTESDLNLGAGGLVDVAGLHGCLRLMTGSNDPLIRPVGSLAPRDWQRLEQARRHLLLVRNHLHFVEGRRQDSLLSERFLEVARFVAGSTELPTVAAGFLVRDIVRRRRQVHQIVRRYLRRSRHDVNARSDSAKVRYLKLTTPASMNLLEGKEASGTPERWMKLFRFGQTEPALFSDELEAALLAQFSTWSFNAFSSPAMHTEFRLMLKQKGRVGGTLRRMRETGFLGRYLPEIGRLDCLPQLDPCRKYTIDEQVFKSIDALDDMAASPGASMHDYQRVLDQVADASLIYLALLLRHSGFRLDPRYAPRHDAVAACALRRLNVESESQEKVLLLVREQRLLAEVSQRRDLDDPFILQGVCDAVETADNLNMLLLLTYVGLQSSEEEGWNERKDFLLWSLYFKVFDRLMFGDEISEPEYAQVAVIQQRVLEQLGTEFETDAVLRHFLLLPEKYALYTPLPQIISHVRLCDRLRDEPVVTSWTPHARAGYTELVLSTRDLPGRFAQIAGTLSSQGISILSAQLNTRDDAVVIDTFQVSDEQGQAIVDADVWRRVDRLLASVISGDRDLDEILASRHKASDEVAASLPAPRLRIDNEIASQSTVIEVQTQDRPGLGYRIAKALADLGLNILSAKLATERNHAFDVFYVQTREGEKVDNSFQMTEVLERLRSALK